MDWYTNTKDGAAQGLVIDSETGRTVAVTYDPRDAELVAAAPMLKRALARLQEAAFSREGTMGDPCRLIECRAELRAAEVEARTVLATLKEEP